MDLFYKRLLSILEDLTGEVRKIREHMEAPPRATMEYDAMKHTQDELEALKMAARKVVRSLGWEDHKEAVRQIEALSGFEPDPDPS